MTKPWTPIDQMDPDELRRYSHFLIDVWVSSPPDGDLSEVYAQLGNVERRMKALGLTPVVLGERKEEAA